MSSRNIRLGDAGERYAARTLEQRGWTMIDQKWRGSGGEIDLIADDGDQIVFVEVKTRRGDARGRAEESVSSSKCARLIRSGLEYIDAHPRFEDRFWRVDLVAITLDWSGRITRYSHIEDACLDE